MLSKASSEVKDKTESKPDVADDASSASKMQQEVKRKQAPKGVKRVDDKHTSNGKPHVHFDDNTALNHDGTIHDKHNGKPKLTNKIIDWLHKHGWCQNGIK